MFNLVSSLVCCAKRTGRRLVSTVDANPFLAAIFCFAADTTSWIRVLQSLRTSTSYTLSRASSLKVLKFGNLPARTS